MVVVDRFTTEMEARSAEIVLKAAGIPSRISGGFLDSIGAFHGGGVANVELEVDAENVEEAERILRHYRQSTDGSRETLARRRRASSRNLRIVVAALLIILLLYVLVFVVLFGTHSA